MKTLYERLEEAGIEIDHHYSDLYFKKTDESMKILIEYKKELLELSKNNVITYSIFTDQINKTLWIDVPFAYDPYWEEKAK